MSERSPRPGSRVSRRAAILLAVVVVGFGAVVAVSVGGAPGRTPAPSPGLGRATAPAFTELPLITVPPTDPAEATPGSAAPSTPNLGSASPSAAATPVAAKGIRANRIRIARLGIDLAIIEGDGIDAPIGKAAHYPGSEWPSGGSNIYIYGHARDGMFILLWKARVGDRIELDLVDGTSRTYVVKKVLPKVPWDAVKYLEPTESEQLTLQTSTSYFPTAPRFVVIAEPAS